jgi:hypothetical protein
MGDETLVHIDLSEKRADLPEIQQGMLCPHCGGETEEGFGLAGGGMGVYTYCVDCGAITSKIMVADW